MKFMLDNEHLLVIAIAQPGVNGSQRRRTDLTIRADSPSALRKTLPSHPTQRLDKRDA
jgi:hypothetical protein